MEGGSPAVEIYVNGLKLPQRDPFLKSNSFRQPLEGQVIRHDKGDVIVTPYVLPPIARLSPDEITIAGGKDGLRGTQGFYVYRARRLVMWGTWFQLVPKDEFFKLTRVQVDIPNSFDELWALDIKKSSAYPPDIIRVRLKELIPHFTSKSTRVVTYEGRKARPANFTPLWDRIEPRHGAFKYQLNPLHPAVSTLSAKLHPDGQKDLQILLDMIGASIPLDAIYADMCSDQNNSDQEEIMKELLEYTSNILQATGLSLSQVLQLDPIGRYPELHTRIAKELAQ
jgi:hypothetical protein